MLLNISLGALFMVVTTAVHAGGMVLAMRVAHVHAWGEPRDWRGSHVYAVGGVVLLMFLVSLVEVFLWAGAYLGLGAIHGLERAVYFSMVTFTTLGYGDVVLDESWRLLASVEAANGIIMFGWTTAIVLAVVRRVYFSPND